MHTLASWRTLVDGLDHPEGVSWGLDGLLYAGGEAGQIYQISLQGKIKALATTGGFVLGLCLDREHTVYACDQKHRAVMRILQTGEVQVYSRGAASRPLMVPNSPAFDAAGNLYVSDSGTWLQDDGCIFVVRPGGAAEVLSTQAAQFPNGLALSPDGQYLYVVLSTKACVVRLPLNPRGRAGAPEMVVALPKTVPDGLAFDRAGNLYISCYAPSAIYCLSPSGQLEKIVEDWQSTQISAPTNLTFAGDDLKTLVAASLSRWHLSSAQAKVAGLPLRYPTL